MFIDYVYWKQYNARNASGLEWGTIKAARVRFLLDQLELPKLVIAMV